MLAALLITGSLGCSTTPPPPAPATPQVADIPWPSVREEARELLGRLLRVNTTNPPGREALAAELLAEYLQKNQVQTEVMRTGPGRASLLARLPGDPTAPPLILLSHLDVAPAELEAWPSETPPFGGVTSDGAIWGRGALGGKGLAVVHAVTLAIISRQKLAPGRTIILASTADGENHGEAGIAALVVARPEILSARLALTEGGFSLRDLVAIDRPVHGIAVAEKGFADIELTATESPDSAAFVADNEASERLARALLALERRQDPAQLTEPMSAFLAAIGSNLGVPELFAWSDSPLARPITLARLGEQPLTHAMINNTVAVTRVRAGVRGAAAPDRARASLRCHLLPGMTPGEMKVRLDHAIDDPNVFLTIAHGDQATANAVDPKVFEVFESVLGAESHNIVAPALSPMSTDARILRRHGVASYGFSPFLVTLAEHATINARNERLPVESLGRGLEQMFRIVLGLAAITPGDNAASSARP